MLKLGRITLDSPFFQASLSGYSDYPMRKLARCFGAPLTFAPLVLAKSAAQPGVLEKLAFKPRDDEHPIGAQILGNDPKVMAKAAVELVRIGYNLIDLNFACPAPKVLRKQRGGYLLKEPEKAIEIFRRVKDAVSCPVTIKLRIGYGTGSESRDNFLRIIEEVSRDDIDALVIHGRCVLQRFTGLADWNFLARLKRRYPRTTIIGSGDLFDAETIVGRLKTAGIDGVAVARGAIGNPWIFRDLRLCLEGKPISRPPSLARQGRTVVEHFELLLQTYEAIKAVRVFRKFLVGYCKRHPQRKKAQQELLAAKDPQEMLAGIRLWYDLR